VDNPLLHHPRAGLDNYEHLQALVNTSMMTKMTSSERDGVGECVQRGAGGRSAYGRRGGR
jgi:hypothetical protein